MERDGKNRKTEKKHLVEFTTKLLFFFYRWCFVQVTKLLLEHDGEFFEGLFGHTSSIASLNLLFQVVFHAHGQLIQLVPLLGKIHCAVFCVSISTTDHM